MYAQKLLLNDHTDKQGTGTSEENKFQLQNNGVRYIALSKCADATALSMGLQASRYSVLYCSNQ